MKRVYNIKLIKKIREEDLEAEEVHNSWASVINNQELYVTKFDNTKVILLFKRRKSIAQLKITKEFARKHFKIIGNGVTNYEGIEIQNFINQNTKIWE